MFGYGIDVCYVWFYVFIVLYLICMYVVYVWEKNFDYYKVVIIVVFGFGGFYWVIVDWVVK